MTTSFFKKNWLYQIEDSKEKNLFEIFKLSRQIKEESLEKFLHSSFKDLSSADIFPDAKKISQRIFRAIDKKEKIIVFGDFDLDGISASAILFETLKALGANVSVLLPSRSDGFGLSDKFVKHAIDNKINLFITCDCGISNCEEIEKLKEHKIDTIITDHHSIGEKVPEAFAIMHPAFLKKQSTDFTGAGVAFKLAQKLLTDKFVEKAENFLTYLLQLAALGTIADVGELKNENRTIVALGIEALKTTKNRGLQKLFGISKIIPESIDSEKIAYLLAPRLNAPGRISHPIYSLQLILGKTENAQLIDQLNERRKELTEKALKEVYKKINTKNAAIIVKNNYLPSGIIGLVCGRIAEEFNKPTVIITKNKTKLIASCRGPENFDFSANLKKLKDLFIKSGGHARAAGFSMKESNFLSFEKKFIALVEKDLGKDSLPPVLKIDAPINQSQLTIENIELLQTFAPFGAGFPYPVFSFKNPQIDNIRLVGKNNDHFSARFNGFSGIGFCCEKMPEFIQDRNIEVAFTPEINTWNNQKEIKLKIVDVRKID